jgi:hypothetical protein
MNTSRLREILDLLLAKEKQYGIQRKLNDLNSHLTNLAANPQQTDLQTQYASSFEALRKAMNDMAASFQPAQVRLLKEIGAEEYFSADIAADISRWIQENPISPAVTQQKVAELVTKRNSFLEDITQVRDRLKKLGVEPATLPPGETEIGFLIPRDLFHNRLDELIKELSVLNRVIRIFAEISTGSTPPIEVRQISTTDPLFFFGIDPVTAAAIGMVVAWALSQWKKVEEIRKLRSDTKRNTSFTDAEVKNFFDTKIESTIEAAVAEKITELLGEEKKAPGRANERYKALEWALESVLARVERGMTVEIRFVPPPAQGADEKGVVQPEPKEFAVLKETIPQLVFPPMDKVPVLELPPPEPGKEPDAAHPKGSKAAEQTKEQPRSKSS